MVCVPAKPVDERGRGDLVLVFQALAQVRSMEEDDHVLQSVSGSVGRMGYYAASVAGLAEASFGATIPDAVNGAAEMICHLFKAPAEHASALMLSAELDETAVRHMRAA
jgi:hypothetical protein